MAEQPPGSNDSPRIAQYRQATAGSGVGPWCAYFVSWAAREAGVPLGDQGQGFGRVDDVWAWGSAPARRSPPAAGQPQPGDLIVWDEHIGIVESRRGRRQHQDDRGQLLRLRCAPHLRRRTAAAPSATCASAEPRRASSPSSSPTTRRTSSAPRLDALAEQGCDAYVIDHGSTDGTADIARPPRAQRHRRRALPRDSGFPARNATHGLEGPPARREQVVREHDYDWYVNNDADEFREAPWPGLTLAEGFARAESLGYNAVNFRVLNFRPTGEDFRAGRPAAVITRFAPPDRCDTPEVKAFKRPDGPLDILGAGGHDVRFDGRRVCPIPSSCATTPSARPPRPPQGARRAPPALRRGGARRGLARPVRRTRRRRRALHLGPRARSPQWEPARFRAELLAAAAESLLAATATRGHRPRTPVARPRGPRGSARGAAGAAGAGCRLARRRLRRAAASTAAGGRRRVRRLATAPLVAERCSARSRPSSRWRRRRRAGRRAASSRGVRHGRRGAPAGLRRAPARFVAYLDAGECSCVPGADRDLRERVRRARRRDARDPRPRLAGGAARRASSAR